MVEAKSYPDTSCRRVKCREFPRNQFGGKLNLTLKTFLELVLKNSTAVNLVRLNVYTANASIQAAKAPYDPATSLRNSISSIGIAVHLADQRRFHAEHPDAEFHDQLPAAAFPRDSHDGGYTASRGSNNSTFNLLNPTLFSTFSFSAFQPLLQDRTRIQVRGPLEIARTQLTITSRQSEAQIADLLATAAVNYWSAVQMRDSVKVYQQTLDLAQKSYARDKQALDLGALAQLDIFQSESQVAGRNR